MKTFDAEAIRRYRHDHECGLAEASEAVKKEILIDRVERAQTVEDLKNVLLVMLGAKSIATL